MNFQDFIKEPAEWKADAGLIQRQQGRDGEVFCPSAYILVWLNQLIGLARLALPQARLIVLSHYTKTFSPFATSQSGTDYAYVNLYNIFANR